MCNDPKSYKLKDGLKLLVRKPQLGDEQGLIDYMKVVDGETKFLAREPDEFSFTVEQEAVFIESALSNENAYFVLGEVEGDIMATCSVGLVSTVRRSCHRAAMGIAIKKDYWNKGAGKALMRGAIDWCRMKGVEQLELDVVTENDRALAMYKSFGFEVCGLKKRALKYADGTYADEHYMILFLDKDEE